MGSPIVQEATITIEYSEKHHCMKTTVGTRLLDALSIAENIPLDVPCGGNGTCGKCKVRVIGSSNCNGISPPATQEKKILHERELESGIRLACFSYITGDCTIALLHDADEAQIMSAFSSCRRDIDPPIKKTCVTLPRPSLEDQRPDDERLIETINDHDSKKKEIPACCSEPGSMSKDMEIDLRQLYALPATIREAEYEVTVTYSKKRIYSVEAGDTTSRCFGISVDIGTTTVVSYLVDLLTGRVMDTVSELNTQKIFGADVITRIDYVMHTEDGITRAQEKIRDQLEGMIHVLTEKKGISPHDISLMTVAGNTTMIHLFLGINPKAIAATPFIPVSLGPHEISASDAGFREMQFPIIILPSISGYIGADIGAGIISSGILDTDGPSLLIDIGTNGEIVLSGRDGLYACSTAAGPAFEGSSISYGMGGVSGAINAARISQHQLMYSTIGGRKPRGICGSGIIDISAILLSSGIADHTGRIKNRGYAAGVFPGTILNHCTEEDGTTSIIIAPAKETENGEAILFTQKDLREVQLAKAAIGAGIETLVHEAGITYGDIKKIYLAGGFGNFINPESALHLGMFPRELSGVIEPVGNAAGQGAVMAACSGRILQQLTKIKESTRYIELSSSQVFRNAYIEHLGFPVIP